MSDTPLGEGWWIASDGKWYAPELHPDYVAPVSPVPPTPAMPQTPEVAAIPPTVPDPTIPVFEEPAPGIPAIPPTQTPPAQPALGLGGEQHAWPQQPPTAAPAYDETVIIPAYQSDPAAYQPGQPAGGFGAPPESPGIPHGATELHTPDAGATATPSNGRRNLILGAAAIILLVGLGFLAFRLLGGGDSGTGAASPEEAVQQLVDSIIETDPVGLVEVVDPDEIGHWISSFSPAIERFEEFAPDQATTPEDYDDLIDALTDAIDIAVTGPDGQEFEYDVLELDERGRVSRVRLNGLAINITANDLDGDVLVFDVVGDAVGLDLARVDGANLSVVERFGGLEITASAPQEETVQEFVENAYLDLITVEKDGEWYISLGYTIIENIRNQPSVDIAQPDFGRAYERAYSGDGGADSAEDAVREWMFALEDIDYGRMIELADPFSLPYLHDYQPAIDENVDPRDTRDAAIEMALSIDVLTLSTTPWNDRTLVSIDEIAGRIGGGSFEVDTTTWCAQANVDGEVFDGCADEAIQELLDEAGISDINPRDVLPERFGMIAIEREGRWYVDLVGTYGWTLEQMADIVSEFDLEELQQQTSGISVDQFTAVRGPLVARDSSATAAPVAGNVGFAFDLDAFPQPQLGDENTPRMALARIESDGNAEFSDGQTADALEWAVVWAGGWGDDPGTWPALTMSTEADVRVSLETLEPTIVGPDGISGTIDADGRPIVILFDNFGDYDFGGRGTSFDAHYDSQGIDIGGGDFARTSGDPSWGEFAVISGDPGATFQIRPL